MLSTASPKEAQRSPAKSRGFGIMLYLGKGILLDKMSLSTGRNLLTAQPRQSFGDSLYMVGSGLSHSQSRKHNIPRRYGSVSDPLHKIGRELGQHVVCAASLCLSCDQTDSRFDKSLR